MVEKLLLLQQLQLSVPAADGGEDVRARLP